MTEHTEFTATDTNNTADNKVETSAEEIAELIVEFEQYRARLLNETAMAAQKAKLPQKAAMAKIEPELAKIDAALDSLRTQHAALANKNN